MTAMEVTSSEVTGVIAGRGVVAWSEADASGRFHFTAPLRWVENAEHAAYRAAVPGIDIGRFPRRAVTADYEQPLAAGDDHTVELAVERLGNSSISYRWRVIGPAGVCVTGSHTVIHVDGTGTPAAVPAPIRAALASAAGRATRPGTGEAVVNPGY